MPDTTTVDVSEEEAMVLAMMRSTDKAGQAIFNYAMRYDDEVNQEGLGIPWRRSYR